MRLNNLILVGALLALSGCGEDTRFELNGPSARDKQSGLIWQRCNLGQRWENDTCSGEPKWTDRKTALELARNEAERSGQGWRLPTIRELSGLMDCRSSGVAERADLKDGGEPVTKHCGGDYASPMARPAGSEPLPAIDKNVFKFASGEVWANFESGQAETWNINFDYGYALDNNDSSIHHHILLVRNPK